mmetsp:Transcript_8070/g.12158  ORF Transcript_8070/g.12158 Transcript_8070/m.12158 type:complete len:195 (-) Transcript_8070:1287-1871(-)
MIGFVVFGWISTHMHATHLVVPSSALTWHLLARQHSSLTGTQEYDTGYWTHAAIGATSIFNVSPPRNAFLTYLRNLLLVNTCPASLDARKTFMHAHTPTTPTFRLDTNANPAAVLKNDPAMMIGRCENDPRPMHTPSESVAIGHYDCDSTANGTRVAIVLRTDGSATSAPATAGARRTTPVSAAADTPRTAHMP